jgi:myosin-5|tara:strand:+ start:2557 stop:2826 length:270 start_codon:yes stop_codon:yes gene_type:complete
MFAHTRLTLSFIYCRDNMKKEITPQLGSCIQAPRATRGGAAARRGGTQTATSTATDGGPQLGTHWRTILDHLDALLLTFRGTYCAFPKS